MSEFGPDDGWGYQDPGYGHPGLSWHDHGYDGLGHARDDSYPADDHADAGGHFLAAEIGNPDARDHPVGHAVRAGFVVLPVTFAGTLGYTALRARSRRRDA